MKEIEHEDEIGIAIWKATWKCPRCPYRNDAADKAAINSHLTTHRLADRGLSYYEGNEGETGGS